MMLFVYAAVVVVLRKRSYWPSNVALFASSSAAPRLN